MPVSTDGPEARAEGAGNACSAAFPARAPAPLAELRAAAGVQPRGVGLGQLVPEYAQVVVLRPATPLEFGQALQWLRGRAVLDCEHFGGASPPKGS
eukprot:9593940-Alexandrium_andersonii.AAC.1